ncbi:autotransporter assembly complex protein TamA [secondary endosymbiont of Ctenarytaina eucalypti]|nr:autotransporter assembly complex family protein [secondary endosymbiont of Ctenarytaina eucalypti]
MPQAYSATPTLQVEGISGDLQRNVCARLYTIDSEQVTASMLFQSRVDQVVREGLRALGYYSPTINFGFKSAADGSLDVLIVHVTPGKPVKIAGVTIMLRGEAQHDSDYSQWVSNSKPAIGAVLSHDAYERFKTGLSSLALRKGYFDAQFCKSQLRVSPSCYQVYWDIDFDSGQRYHFGRARFYGTQIGEEYLQSLANVQEGAPYSAALLVELNHRLAATNWFNSVVISPHCSTEKQRKTLSLDVFLTPHIRNSFETGVGYATALGPRLKTTWIKSWLNSRGHSLQTSLTLSVPEQSVDVSYKIPLLRDPLAHYYLLKGGCKREHLNNTQADSTMLHAERYWDLSSGWQKAVNVRWSLDHFIQANVTDTTMLIYPGLSINRIRQSSKLLLMPAWGISQRYSLDISNTLWGSNIDFIIYQAQNIWIRTMTEKQRFLGRGNMFWIATKNFERVPPSLRFFAGGDRSIRGYKYKSLSPKENNGLLTGASRLVTGSLEYQYKLSGKWWYAVFLDSGEAVNDIKKSTFKTGAGVGVRWYSPFGPIKLDMAIPVSDEHEHGVQFYIGLGPEL